MCQGYASKWKGGRASWAELPACRQQVGSDSLPNVYQGVMSLFKAAIGCRLQLELPACKAQFHSTHRCCSLQTPHGCAQEFYHQDPDSRQGGMGLLQVLQLTGRKLSAQRTRTFTCASK